MALQGAYAAHRAVIRRLGHETVEVRTVEALRACDGLVLPGGESTTQLRLLALEGLDASLIAFARAGHPVLATCAGAILLAARVTAPEQRSLGLLDVDIERNGFGRQSASFEAVGDRGTPLVCIRAPRITRVGPEVEVLETLRGEPMMVRRGALVAATFHPELTDSPAVHALAFRDLAFLSLAASA